MAKFIVLDSEGLSSLANAHSGGKNASRAHAIVTLAKQDEAKFVIPVAIVVEVYRGPAQRVAINRVLKIGSILSTGLDVAKTAAGLLYDNQMDSVHAIDAIVVATAVELRGATVVTGDPDDIGRLASRHPEVRVFAL